MSSREIMDAMNGIATRKSYGFRDPVVKRVCDKFVSRSDIGYEKYGQTLDDDMLFIIHSIDFSVIIQGPKAVSHDMPTLSNSLPFNLLTGQGNVVVISVTFIFI